MFRLDKLYDIEDAVRFIEEGLKAELKKEGLKEVEADFLDCKRWFAESFRCPINAAELKSIVNSAKSRTLLALKEEGIKNSEFMIKNVEYIQDRDTKDYIMRCTIYFEEEEVKAVPVVGDKFIVKSCYHLMNSVYADGREAHNECGNSLTDEKCCNIEDCHLKQIANNLLKVVKDPACRRCDGCGYEEGCMDESCGTYAAYKCLELFDIEFVE